MAENGRVATTTETQLESNATADMTEPRALAYTMDDLTTRDFKRARVVLGGRNPFEVVEADPLDAMTLIIWCIKSRVDPDFTWEQAEDTPHSWLRVADSPLPPSKLPESSRSNAPRSKAKQNAAE